MSTDKPAMRSAIATAICKSKTCEGIQCCQWPANMGRTVCPVKLGYYDDAADAVLELIASQRAEPQAVPDGWQLVPKEPTHAILRAAHDGPLMAGDEPMGPAQENWLAEMYKSMIAAASKPEEKA